VKIGYKISTPSFKEGPPMSAWWEAHVIPNSTSNTHEVEHIIIIIMIITQNRRIGLKAKI